MPRYVDVEALRKEFSERPPDYYSTGYILNTIDEQPALSHDEARGVGKWINKTMSVPNAHGQTYNRWGCSVCKAKFKSRTNYCPSCGAKMEVSDDD